MSPDAEHDALLERIRNSTREQFEEAWQIIEEGNARRRAEAERALKEAEDMRDRAVRKRENVKAELEKLQIEMQPREQELGKLDEEIARANTLIEQRRRELAKLG
jgi:hypothetical protein